jgi:FkbM family methyltransferase
MSEIGTGARSPLLHRAYRFVNRPYYWYRPAQLAQRMRVPAETNGEPRLLRTAWGDELFCFPDPLGASVARTGVYDLVVAETLARLAEPGETAVDAGANVGLMSNLLAHAVGAGGRVVSFEPHPLIFGTLMRNVARWRERGGIAPVDARQAAVSARTGSSPLAIDPDTFAGNKGTASLEHSDPANATEVRTVRLDEELAEDVGVLKLDVEMHELAALEGSQSLSVRDIVFEEHEAPPTPVTALLQERGYTVLGVRQGLTGPVLSTPEQAYARRLWDPPALLATRDVERARGRLGRRGWVTLRNGLGARGA